jgi:hypothetical protein
MSASPPKRKMSPWKLAGAMCFLGFSLWLTVGPWVEDILGPLPFMRDAQEEQEHVYGGFEASTDLLRIHASYTGDPRQISDPFRWNEVVPDASPGGIATVQVTQEVSTSSEITQTPEAVDEPEEEIPQLQVRLILRTKGSSRALVDGQILGVGDPTRAGTIVQILDTGVETRYRGKKLFFALSPR